MMATGNRLPYPGLRAFTRDEADVFFGRDGSIDSMVDRLAATRFLAVLGPSGSGKSSLVRTGLLDALDLGLHPWAGSRWQIADLHPGGQPLRNLAMALFDAKGSVPEAIDVDLLATFLSHGPRSVAEWATGGNLQVGSNLLILVDQFEELFRYGDYAQREEAEAFVGLLLESAGVPGVPIHVVITMRSEYLGACTLIPGLAEQINSGLYLTPRMGREECREAIEGPAGVMGFKVQPALVNRLLNDLASFAPWEAGESANQLERLARRADQLPLMQHVLNRLWVRTAAEAGNADVELKLTDYEQIGGLTGALDAHGAEVIAALGVERARHIEGVFRALVSGTSLALAVRRPCQLGELVEIAQGARDDVVAIAETFGAPDCNFIRTSERHLTTDSVIIDISHESLIRQWTPLSQWLMKEVRDTAAWRRLVDAEQRHAQGEGGLLTGLDLHGLRAWWDTTSPKSAWAARHGGKFEAVQLFLENSQDAETARVNSEFRKQTRERNRLRAVIAGLTAALAVAIWASSFAWRQMQTAAGNAQNAAQLLDSISDALHSDRHANLIGFGNLQAELMKILLPHQAEIREQYSNMVDSASIIRNEYRLGVALETLGEAEQALQYFARAYDRGREAVEALPIGQKPPETLTAYIIEIGYRYAWFLYDIGEDEKGEYVLRQLTNLAAPYNVHSTSAELLLQYARLENLKSRLSTEKHRPDSAKEEASQALELISLAVALPNATMDARRLEFTLYENLISNSETEDKKRLLDKICGLADRMIEENPMDRRAIEARLSCLREKASDAGRNGDIDTKARLLKEARTKISTALDLVPDEQGLLLIMAEIEIDIGHLAYEQGNENERRDHNISAKNYFVKALEGRTLFQDSPNQIKYLYTQIILLEFPKEGTEAQFSSDELAFYKSIADAVAPTATAFPKARSFAYVAADAASHVGTLLLKDSERLGEAETYLSQAAGFFKNSRAISDLFSYSEEFTAYCGAYARRAELYGLTDRVDDMINTVDEMSVTCGPALEKYPWDFYLRQHFMGNARRAGALLSKNRRHADAVKYLEYASQWGDRASSELLSRAYLEGLGVDKDEEKAGQLAHLARNQSVKRFTIDAYFGGRPAVPLYVYTYEWPKEHPSVIDDQVKWLAEARGGQISPDVEAVFKSLYNIARVNDVPFGDLCVYALGKSSEGTNGLDIDGGRFDMVAAALLMSSGSYETITNFLHRNPTLEAEVSKLGRGMMKHNIKPDMGMVARLREIYERILREQKERAATRDTKITEGH